MTTIQAIDLLKGLEQSLDDYCELNDEGKTAFRMAITALEVFGLSEQLPSAQPEPRWIPVTERLPEPMGWDKSYLVSLAWGGVGVMEYKSTGVHNYGSFSPVPIETVTAWMPLPEPYKERREE